MGGMATQLPVKRTIVTLDALAEILWQVWPDAEDIDVAILFGKLVAENGWPNDKQTTWNWNVGNIRGVSPAGNYHTLKNAWELVSVSKVDSMKSLGWVVIPAPPQAVVTPGTVCMLPPPERQGFRAYLSLREAVEDYLDVIGRSFRSAWAELQREGSDPTKFVAALKADKYFSGDLSQYTNNVRAGVSHALARMPVRPVGVRDTDPAPPPVEIEPDEIARLPRADAPVLGVIDRDTRPAEGSSSIVADLLDLLAEDEK